MTTCGCDDPSLFVWFLEWPAYALAHGHNPFYSTALFHPAGINLLSNTGVLALGLPLAPVTWLFGPVATLNVASTLGPALSALAMFWLLRRWVRWAPAAFVGGLVFGFGPFAVTNLAVAHLKTEVLVLVPLIVGCLDELLVRQRETSGARRGRPRAPRGRAVLLSTEMLVIVVICARRRRRPGRRLRHRRVRPARCSPPCGTPLSPAWPWPSAVSGVLLAYPVWFALRVRPTCPGWSGLSRTGARRASSSAISGISAS